MVFVPHPLFLTALILMPGVVRSLICYTRVEGLVVAHHGRHYRPTRVATLSSSANNNDPHVDARERQPPAPPATTAGSTTTTVVYTVGWKTSNGIVEFPAIEGETLRTAALRRGVVSPHNGRSQLINCRGLGTCGTCAVLVQASSKPGGIQPIKPNLQERIRLSLPPHGPGIASGDEGLRQVKKDDDENSDNDNASPELRLACQIQIFDDLEVTKRSGFWGQYKSTLSTHNECQTYFGELEFLLDGQSPPSQGDRKD